DGEKLESCLHDMLARKGPRLLEVILKEEKEPMNVTVQVGGQNAALPKTPDRFFIDGKWVDAISENRIDVVSPVTEERLFSYPEAGAPDIDRAVWAARDAFDNGPWPKMPASERAGYLRKVAEILTRRL